MIGVHPVVPNPYTLLTTINDSNVYFTVLDFKDAFFCIPLEEQSQQLFTLEWESPTTRCKMQLCWPVLPQGFKNSPTIFGNGLAKEIELWQGKKDTTTLSQYVDDILLGADRTEECRETTISLLHFWGTAGYKVSQKKVEIMKESVIYLGFEISQGERKLGI